MKKVIWLFCFLFIIAFLSQCAIQKRGPKKCTGGRGVRTPMGVM